MLALFVMAVWIGGLEFPRIVSNLIFRFLAISFIALVLGLFVSANRIHWSLLLGMLCGLAGGMAIVLHAVSGI